jgi:hypothetical protein
MAPVRKRRVELVIDQESFRAARERPEAKEALKRWAAHIADLFFDSLSPEDAQVLIPWFDTPEGNEALRELWPKIIDAYFRGLCNRKQ